MTRVLVRLNIGLVSQCRTHHVSVRLGVVVSRLSACFSPGGLAISGLRRLVCEVVVGLKRLAAALTADVQRLCQRRLTSSWLP